MALATACFCYLLVVSLVGVCVAARNFPAIGLGTSFFPEDLRPGLTEKELTEAAVEIALKAGTRLIDCANGYSNQKHVGTALDRAFQTGLATRSEVVLVGKVSQARNGDDIKRGVDQMLSDLHVDYVDILMPHSPPSLDVWIYFEKEVTDGRAKYLGVSNFDQSGVQSLQELYAMAHIKPIVHQFEVHPLQRNEEMVNFCQQTDIAVMAYSPLGAPHKIGKFLKAVSAKVPEQAAALREKLNVLSNPIVVSTSKKHGVSPAQVVLWWHHRHGYIPIPKSYDKSRVAQNGPAALLDNKLTDEDFAKLNSIDQGPEGQGIRALRLYRAAQRGLEL